MAEDKLKAIAGGKLGCGLEEVRQHGKDTALLKECAASRANIEDFATAFLPNRGSG
jgi:hypothetical protein